MSRFGIGLLVLIALSWAGSSAHAQKVLPKAADDVDPEPRLAFQYDPDMRFGLTVVKDTAGKPLNKRLTFSPDGGTNDYMVRIDGQDMEFGGPDGKWLQKNVKVGNASKSVWLARGIEISQILEIVPSKQTVEVAVNVRKRLMDTCLVRYEIENKDKKDHKVGMRIMVDTLIGANDGVPFAVPTVQGLVNTFKDFATAKEVPDFVQALEVPDLQKPGTVGLMTLKVGGNIEAPDRVSLTNWADVGVPLKWEIPVRNMMKDSAVILYWNADKALKPQEKRVFGFAYGLGHVSADEGTGRLALTANGSFLPGSEFTVTAYVQKPAKDETVTLELPKGVERVKGDATEKVPMLTGLKEGNTSTVTWTLKAADRGSYAIRVRSSAGVAQTQNVTIRGE